MTFDEAVLSFVDTMLKNGGPLVWANPETPAAIADAAFRLAELLYGTGPNDMATQAVYYRIGTPVVFTESGGDVVWTAKNIANAAGYQSAMYDQDGGAWGASRRPDFWLYRLITQAVATPTAGNILDVRLNTSDGTNHDSGSNADGSVAAIALLSNCSPLQPVIVTAAAANTVFSKAGRVVIASRYFGVALWNLMGSNTRNTANTTQAIFTPVWADVGPAV